MGETKATPEASQYNREQVIEAFREFSSGGIAHPDDLDMSDPQVAEAYKILDTWTAQEQNLAKKKGSAEAELEFDLSRSTIFVDAGFSDKDYLDEVANDWLVQYLDIAETAGLAQIAKKIQTKMDEIDAKFKS